MQCQNRCIAVLFADKFLAVQKCKTQAEVEAVMGCPPGVYDLTQPNWTRDEIGEDGVPIVLASNYRQHFEPIRWIGDDCLIIVEVSINGREVDACYVVPNKNYRPE